MSRECSICGRRCEDEDELCPYHSGALENLKEAFVKWKHSLGVSWDEYLERLEQLDTVGRWVKEVIVYLKDREQNVDPTAARVGTHD